MCLPQIQIQKVACISIHILDECDRSQSQFASQTFAESKYILEYHQAQDDIILFVSKFRYNDAHPHYSTASVLRVVMSKLISHWDGDRFCDGYRYSLRIFEARTDPNSLCSRDCFPMFSRFNTINIDQYAILSTCEKSMVGMVGVTQMP